MADSSRPAAPAASSSFDEHDYTTWAGATLPVGYRWVDAGNGEEHLVSPDGRDLSAAEWGRITGEPYGVVVTAPALCGECGHRVDVHRAAFGDRLAGCHHQADGRVCPCDLTAARIEAARRPATAACGA